MPLHAARRLISERAATGGQIDAEVELSCGCTIRIAIPRDRIVEFEDGRRLPAGKYRCPAGHPVRRP